MATHKDASESRPVLARTAYVMGISIRGLVNAVTFPYRAISGKTPQRPRRVGSGPTARTLAAGKAVLRRATERTRRRPGVRQTPLVPRMQNVDVPLEAARIATRDGLHKLSRALASPDVATRTRAVQTVGEFDADRAAPIITAVLQDPDPAVRQAAAAAAANTRASSTVFSLILALDDPAVEVRREVKLAIEVITKEQVDLDPAVTGAELTAAIERLKEWWKERRLAQLVTSIDEVSGS